MHTDCYCILLRTAARKVTAIYDEALGPIEVNIAQFSLLRRIARKAPISLTDLAALCDLDRSTVGRNAKVLERKTLVAVTKAKDQREACLTLTEAGRQVLEAGAPLWDAAQTRLTAAIGPDAIVSLKTLAAGC
ncbi:MAG: MarR family transcriptional regulator [Ancalomicrobiaceae bacterium]|nr:MarR family transcriptional regulator [Ancalomicrobiaceae bacterium]